MALDKQNGLNQSAGKTILALILLIIVVVGVFMFVLPKRDELKDVKVTLSQKESEVTSLKSKLAQIKSLEQSFVGSEVTLMDTLNLIPETTEQSEVINTLSTIADDNEVSMSAISFSLKSATDTDVNVLLISTNIAGTHKSLLDFLADLEKSSRKFVVKSISVQKLQNILENMSVSIEAYYL